MRVVFDLVVNDVNVAAELQKQKQLVKELNKELLGVEQGTAEYTDLVNQIAAARVQVINLTNAQKELNRQFKESQLPKDSLAAMRIEYSRLTEQVTRFSAAERASQRGQATIARAKALKDEINNIEQSLGRFTGSVGNYRIATENLVAGFRQLFAVLSIGFGADIIIQNIARVSDAIAEVQKTAQLTEAQARELAEQLRFRDTRTSLAEQLQIAAIGGQLGIATEQLKQFTEATDVLNVALGDQFGNVENITREFAGLRNVLTDFKTENVSDDILKLGNAVNFLEAQGAATAPVIVDFASRIAGAAVPLGATTEQILGLSTALAELNITPERGATAVQRLFIELAKAPEVFAAAIGEPAQRFTEFVQTDIVGALGLVAERVSQSSTVNTAFAKTLDDLGIGAQGAIEVFGKLGGSIDLVDKRIQETTESITNANSVTAEFESKNNNAAAAIDKLQNSIVNLFTGNFAQDAVEAFANSLTAVIDAIANAPETVEKYRAELIALSAALIIVRREQIGTTLVTISQSRAWQVLTSSTARAAAATKLLELAQKALPIVAVAAAVYGLIKAIDSLSSAQDAAADNAERLANAQSDINEQAAKEIATAQQLIDVLKSETSTKEARSAAIDELLRQYPDYLRGIDLEKASISDLTKIQQGLNTEIIKGIAERRKATEVNELLAKSVQDIFRAQQLRESGDFTRVTVSEVREFVKTEEIGLGNILNNSVKLEAVLKGLEARAAATREQANNLAAAFDRAFDLRPDVERNISAAEQDQLDLQRQFADRSGKLTAAVSQSVNTIEKLEERIKALRTELNKTEIGTPRFRELQQQIRELERQLAAARQTAKAADNEAKRAAKEREAEAIEQLKRIQGLRDEIRQLDAQTIGSEFDRREIESQNRRMSALEEVENRRLELEKKIQRQKGAATDADKQELALIAEQTASIIALYDQRDDELSQQREDAAQRQKDEIARLSLEVATLATENAERLAEIQREQTAANFDAETRDLKNGLAERQRVLGEQLLTGEISRRDFDRQQIEAQEQFNVKALEIEQRRAAAAVRIAEQLRDAKIQAAQASLAAELNAIQQSAAADIAQIRKRGIEQGIDPALIAEQVAQRELEALQKREAANIKFAETVTDANQAVTDAQIAGLDAVNQADENVHQDKMRRLEQEAKRREQIRDAVFDSLQTLGNTLVTVERDNLEQTQNERLRALDAEFATRREKAGHNAAQLEKLDKEYQKRRLEIEKQAARERKKIALKEAVIQGALNVIKLLSNPFAAAAAAIAAAAQIAIIAAQEFAHGGVAKRLKPGVVRERQNAPRTALGDTVLAYLAPGEMMLNVEQQRAAIRLAGHDFFHKIGVPNVSKHFIPGVQAFQGGGVADVIPQIALPGASADRQVVVVTEATFSPEQIELIANEVAKQTGIATQTAIATGLNDANRRAERENILNEQREQ